SAIRSTAIPPAHATARKKISTSARLMYNRGNTDGDAISIAKRKPATTKPRRKGPRNARAFTSGRTTATSAQDRNPMRIQRARPIVTRAIQRSEEHTSELQSLTNLVCRLLLEKKNNNQS